MQIELRQIGALTNALLDALSRSEMENVVLALGERPGSIGSDRVTDDVFFRDAVAYFNRRSYVDRLIIQSRAQVPDNPLLFDFARQMGLATQLPAEAPDPTRLEGLIRARNPMFNFRNWVQQLTNLEGRICKVKVGTQLGTGFLVGPEAVMTNYHVAVEAIQGSVEPREIRLTFDTGIIPNGVTYGLAGDWLIDYSPHSDQDGRPQDTPADVPDDQLDYAVLRVAKRIGEQPGGGDMPGADNRPPRGWIALSDLTPAFEDNPGMVILQHGGGRALQMAVDTEAFVTLNRRKTRVYYRTTTEGGSSGSPCFDMDMNFVALHQAFVSRLGKDDKANTGVPVDAIYRLLDKRGKLGDVIGRS